MDEFIAALDEKDLKEGSMKKVSVEGIPVLFIKQFGQIFAIDNRCPHMGCGFSGGTLDGAGIICPCHDWRFNLRTGEFEDDPTIKLVKFEYKIESGKIYLKLPDDK